MSSQDNKNEKVDALVVGGGPVGLITTYNLLREGVNALAIGECTYQFSRTHIDIISCHVEQFEKDDQAQYGRAMLLYPRSLELLDQLGLLDDIRQIGYTMK